jgi:hypothetical protein
MSDDELANKFRECAAWGGLPKPNIEKVVDLVFNLEKLTSIRDLTRLLARVEPRPARRPAAKRAVKRVARGKRKSARRTPSRKKTAPKKR